MAQFNEKFAERVLEVNEKGALKQNVRNALKADVMKAFAEMFSENAVNYVQIKDGLAVEFAHKELGSFVVVVDFVMKDLQFDVLGAENEYLENLKQKAEKAEKQRLAKEKRLKEKEKVAEK